MEKMGRNTSDCIQVKINLTVQFFLYCSWMDFLSLLSCAALNYAGDLKIYFQIVDSMDIGNLQDNINLLPDSQGSLVKGECCDLTYRQK